MKILLTLASLLSLSTLATYAQEDLRQEADGQHNKAHRTLASGHWVKIAVPESGIYQLTDSMLQSAGFDNPASVKVYGYGGDLQPEILTASYIADTDTLPQVPTLRQEGRMLFYGVGPVNWMAAEDMKRTRNHYSNVGCYFLTENDDKALTVDNTQFATYFHPTANDFHSLYEVDDFAWYHGGRNLYDQRLFGPGNSHDYKLCTAGRTSGHLSVAMSYNNYCSATVSVNGTKVGEIVISTTTTKGNQRKAFPDTYSLAATDVWTFDNVSMPAADSVTVTITQDSGADMRLDYIDIRFDEPAPMADLNDPALPMPDVMGIVSNQDLHSDPQADMVIIIPESEKLRSQAEQLAQLHKTSDGMRVNIVRADQLYNEFSSGTPDANAYRRYLRMLYERAETEADKPRFLLLMGDAAFDNRMLTSDFSQTSPKDFLLCYESDNSFSETACYVSDDFFGLLDDGEGGDIVKTDKIDVAVGRLPARTAEEAQVMVDKTISYRMNDYPGAWQNTICMMGDDGNANMHMNDAETVTEVINEIDNNFNIKKIYWDAYQRTSSPTGYAYPDVSRLIRQQMREGALIMNYSGHGNPRSLSHERVIDLTDFKDSTSMHLPLWFTASCDIAPFDGYLENIGEQAMMNRKGGAVAFVGTTRTVYALHNKAMNKAFMAHLLERDDTGLTLPIGEAIRKAKNDQARGAATQVQAGINKLHFALLGDPAIRLKVPTLNIVVDEINGQPANSTVSIIAGETATVSGHIEGYPGFNGTATLTVKDVELTITCRINATENKNEMPKEPLVYNDRPGTLYEGSDNVSEGTFQFVFAVPKDVTYEDANGLLIIYAVNDDHTLEAHGTCDAFTIMSADSYDSENLGPVITAWLDSPNFTNGSATSQQPLFHAELFDEDGINVSGSGIGHSLELTIDGMMRYTYDLDSYFTYSFGDYRRGTVEYRIPALEDGQHVLTFRAWDVLNNSTLLKMAFSVGGTGNPSSINEIGSTQVESEYYDIHGWRVNNIGDGRPRLLIVKNKDGKVQKKLTRGNK